MKALTTDLCNVYMYPQQFEGINALLAFPFRRDDPLRRQFDAVITEYEGNIMKIVRRLILGNRCFYKHSFLGIDPSPNA